MITRKFPILLVLFWCSNVLSFDTNFRLGSGRITVNINVNNDNTPSYSIVRDEKVIQNVLLDKNDGKISITTSSPNGLIINNLNGPPLEIQLIEDEAQFSLVSVRRDSTQRNPIKDCFDLRTDINSWYGGPQQSHQYWPIDRGSINNYSYVTKSNDNCGVAERYWLNSNGLFIYVDEKTPLFIDQNMNGNYLCLTAKKELPYDTHSNSFSFNYFSGVGINPKDTHMNAIRRFLGKPTGHPAERMVQHPIWSTWARYKRDIDEKTVLEFADEILANQFKNSQLEIDDDWEVCYGALEFRTSKFPNITNVVKILKAKGFAITLWVHPFINKGCEPWYTEAKNAGYLVADHNNNTDTQWWNSQKDEAAYIDFTKPAAEKWFIDRLRKLQDISGIDSYKFDAGETSWSPGDPVLNVTPDQHPLAIQTVYINSVAQFGPLVEVRSGFRNQDLPIFMRMLDKDSGWTFNNGLPTLVTTLLVFNMVGYPFVLPDMIGGNGYGNKPDKELFIRWLQANVFMPSLQFSFVPWDYDEDTIEICQFYTELHANYTYLIMNRFELAVRTGEPVNPPLWWIDPDDRTAHMIDDQFLLGEDILVAPILNKGQISRNIYLPRGQWADQVANNVWTGPRWLMDYSAPIFVLPHFKRVR